MILFEEANPLDEIANIIKIANPAIADDINGTNIIVDKIQNVNPDLNDGFNTLGIVRAVGDLNDTVGAIPVRFNRLDLAKYIPWNMVQVPCPSERGRVMPMNLEGVISKALGTKMESTGRYADYNIYTAGFACAKGQLVEIRITPLVESLRYKPTQISVKVFGLGTSLEHAINAPSVTPFTDAAGGIMYTGAGKTWWDDNPRLPDNTKRSSVATLGMCDFTSVWGEDPRTVIEEHGIADKPKYRFNSIAFIKVNAILAAQGLPAIPNPYFSAYTYNSNNDSSMLYNRTPIPKTLNRCLHIMYSNTDNWDYFNLADLHDEANSAYWGLAADNLWLNYQYKP